MNNKVSISGRFIGIIIVIFAIFSVELNANAVERKQQNQIQKQQLQPGIQLENQRQQLLYKKNEKLSYVNP